MSSMDETKPGGGGGWPPRDALPHIPAHTPIQIPRQADGVSPATFMQHQTAWRFAQPFTGLPTQNGGIFTPPAWPSATTEWPTQPSGSKLSGEWNELPRPLAMVLSTALPSTSTVVESERLPENKPEDTHREEEQHSEDKHTASYDVSASQSPDDAPPRRENSEEHIDVENSNSPLEEPMDTLIIDEEQPKPESPKPSTSTVVTTANLEFPQPTPVKEDEATRLLLSFSQQSFPKAGDEPTVTSSGEKPMEFTPSSLSAFSEPTNTQTEVSSTFCRPPGLGPAAAPPSAQGSQLLCPICGFTSNSKFHYNSHMNTHGDHKCLICDYTSRTEGRLKKHMRESHTIDQQLAVGLEVQPQPSSTSTSESSSADTSALSSTMATIVDVANAVAAGNAEAVATTLASLGFETADGNLLSTISSTTGLPNALEKMREFAEKSSNLLPDSSMNLVTALGAMADLSPEESPNKNNEPRRSSNGKLKEHKCKDCNHISHTKNEYWDHRRTHILKDKQMNCNIPHCRFVTEYKHHLEYHKLNHEGKKPFQCEKCGYSCVNKSMLNSHMKSHTNVYQFRCMDCTYATKYCHSLKLHLKKYNHQRVPDGIDLGRGESPANSIKTESLSGFSLGNFCKTPTPVTTLAQSLGLGSPMVTSQSLNYASQMLLRQHQMEMSNLMGLNTLAGLQPPQMKCAMCEFQTGSQEELMRHSVTHIMATTASPIVSLYQSLPQMSSLIPGMAHIAGNLSNAHEENNTEVHEHHESDGHDDEMDGTTGSATSPDSCKDSTDDEHKRKSSNAEQGEGIHGKSPLSASSSAEKDAEDTIPASSSVSPTDVSSMVMTPLASAFANLHESPMDLFQKASCIAQLTSALQKRDAQYQFHCEHCGVAFQDTSLYQMHMGCHCLGNPLKCNRCGYFASDSYHFNMHLVREAHD